MRLLYGSIANGEAAQAGFSDYSNAQQLDALSRAAAVIDGRLGRIYGLPVSVRATGSLVVPGLPVDGATCTVSSVTYRFKDTPAAVNDVQIGATAAASGVNLARAINASSQGGYYAGTVINPDVEALTEGATVSLRVRFGGTPGNVLTLSSATLTVTAFAGGSGDFSALIHIELWLAMAFLLRGANPGPGQNQSAQQPQDYYRMAMDMLEELASLKAVLADDDGVDVALDTLVLPWSDTSDLEAVPFADEGDPCLWDHDADKDWDRS